MDSDKLFDNYMNANTALWIEKAHRRLQTSYNIAEEIRKGLDLTPDQQLRMSNILLEQHRLEKIDLEKHEEALRVARAAYRQHKGMAE